MLTSKSGAEACQAAGLLLEDGILTFTRHPKSETVHPFVRHLNVLDLGQQWISLVNADLAGMEKVAIHGLGYNDAEACCAPSSPQREVKGAAAGTDSRCTQSQTG